MRKTSFAIALLIAAGQISPGAAADSAFVSQPGFAAASHEGKPLPVALFAQKVQPNMSPVLPVQILCQRGHQMCVNRWVWVCQCFATGCQYTPTAGRYLYGRPDMFCGNLPGDEPISHGWWDD